MSLNCLCNRVLRRKLTSFCFLMEHSVMKRYGRSVEMDHCDAHHLVNARQPHPPSCA
uniref:Uncharacterized protein n=1 Tax=Mesocestoides corti TaxID=53468 RepID=A0A5K3EKG1_MESCO